VHDIQLEGYLYRSGVARTLLRRWVRHSRKPPRWHTIQFTRSQHDFSASSCASSEAVQYMQPFSFKLNY